MRHLVTFVSALVLSAPVLPAAGLGPAAGQASDAVKTVAGILLTVNHFPSDAEKATLEELAAQPTTTENEKVLIEALVNMEHSVREADEARLAAIAADQSAPESVRTVAEILGRFLHMASDEDKAALKELAM